MPAALKPYRDDELRNLRGDDQQGPYETHHRVYRYDVYNDLGEGRPILGGTGDHPYPRRGRTGRKLSQTGSYYPWVSFIFRSPIDDRLSTFWFLPDPRYETRLLPVVETNYVPRDEVFGHLKMADFYGYTIKALVDGIVPAIRTYVDLSPGEFDSFQDVIKLYEGGIKLPNIPALEDVIKLYEGGAHQHRRDHRDDRLPTQLRHGAVVRRLQELELR
jgi:linoleate 9S-lipoxygenase